MKRVGNVASNRIYNPLNTRPPIPFDADEADTAMDRFIKQKYQDKVPSPTKRHHTGSTNSDDHPPPLPPKTGSRFGFRSASSIFPLSSKAKREAAATARLEQEQNYARPDSGGRSPSPPRRNKPSRIFGTAIGGGGSDDLDVKLAKLRDMGFRDEHRNEAVLKGHGGNLEKSIETLVRLEGGGVTLKSVETSGLSSQSRTPISPGAGLSFNRAKESPASKVSDNPFDMLDLPRTPAQPQSSQSTGSLAQPQLMGNNPYQQKANGNPYGLQPSQSQFGLNQAFQNMALSNPQSLFPNHTGGFPAPQPQAQQSYQMYQHSMTPPVPSMPQQYHSPVIYENPSEQPQGSFNPFMQQQQHVRQAPLIQNNFQSNPYSQQQQPTPQATPVSASNQTNPFMQQNQSFNAHSFGQNPALQSQSPYYNNGAQQQQPQPLQSQNPYMLSGGQQQIAQQSYNNYPMGTVPGYNNQPQMIHGPHQANTFPLTAQQTGRVDKRSILDLYNYPQLAPTASQQQVGQDQSQHSQPPPLAIQVPQQQMHISTPMSAPATTSRNPFNLNAGGGGQTQGGDTVGALGQFAPAQNITRHVSQESVDVGGWQSGRHSPDAWGQISARSVR
jgi:hypothetical protein